MTDRLDKAKQQVREDRIAEMLYGVLLKILDKSEDRLDYWNIDFDERMKIKEGLGKYIKHKMFDVMVNDLFASDTEVSKHYRIVKVNNGIVGYEFSHYYNIEDAKKDLELLDEADNAYIVEMVQRRLDV